jgi:hypothetical protein
MRIRIHNPASRIEETQTLGDMTSAPYSRLYRLDITSSRSLVFFTGKNLTEIFQAITSVADPGCFSIPDPGSDFFHPGSASKNLSILTQKIVFLSKLSEK